MPKNKLIKINIDKQEISCSAEQTILQIAKANDIFIPSLCDHPDLSVKANCLVCVVEIKGRKNLAIACSTKIEEGMEILTSTDRVRRARNLNLELIFAEHIERCATCVWRYECKLLKYAERYKVVITRFKDRKGFRRVHKFANSVEIDGTQCIDCRNCIEVCSRLQNINYLELKGKGINQEVVPTKDKKKQCILCGQCAVHCPVSSAQEQMHWEMVEMEIKNKDKIVVAQFAPSTRVSIGEDFGLDYGKIVTENVVAGLRSLGFQYVFDVNFGADVTTITEAEELLERLRSGSKLPMLTSCCPSWINYIEFYHPELVPNIANSRSPQIHGGGIIKTYWAKKMKIDPRKIVVVSIMPCTAKKYEAARPELKINNLFPVDYVLTTREFTFLLKKHNLDLIKLMPSQADDPLAEFTGGAALYGVSGGVMESALRTAQYIVNTAQSMNCDKRNKLTCQTAIDFTEVRGLDGVKEADVKIGDKKLHVAVVNGIGNIEKLISRLNNFHYAEIMACPGGCIGGGGQPIPTSAEIRQKRQAALYQLDKNSKLRISYENKAAQAAIAWLKKNSKLAEQVLYTRYKKKTKY